MTFCQTFKFGFFWSRSDSNAGILGQSRGVLGAEFRRRANRRPDRHARRSETRTHTPEVLVVPNFLPSVHFIVYGPDRWLRHRHPPAAVLTARGVRA